MIIPSSSDPRLNTAECVSHVDDDANDSVDQMIYERPKYGVIISTFLTFVCLFGGSLIYRFLISTHCAIDENRLFALKFTAIFVIIVDCMLLVYTCVIVMRESSLRNSTSAVIFVFYPFRGPFAIIAYGFYLEFLHTHLGRSRFFFQSARLFCLLTFWRILILLAYEVNIPNGRFSPHVCCVCVCF